MARKRVSDLELKAVLRAEIASSIGHMSGSIADERAKSMDFYLGDMDKHLPVPTGRSKAVSTDVQDVIEGLMPSLMEIFTGGDEVARFNPVGPEDEDASQQETDYVNHVFYNDNDGFLVLYEALKDALMQKTGVIKRWTEKVEEKKRERYEGLTPEGKAFVLKDGDAEIVEYEDRDDGLCDMAVLRVRKVTKFRLAAVENERFSLRRQAFIALALLFLDLLGPTLDDAGLLHQGVLQRLVQHQEPVVVVVENVVYVVGFLLRCVFVFRSHRVEPRDLIAARENLHERGHQALDDILHVRGHGL
jgi:hypothetical protein